MVDQDCGTEQPASDSNNKPCTEQFLSPRNHLLHRTVEKETVPTGEQLQERAILRLAGTYAPPRILR